MNDIIRESRFGIELETCICSLNYKNPTMYTETKYQEKVDEKELDLFYEHIVEITRKKGQNIWEKATENHLDYSMWNIVYDHSVHCFSDTVGKECFFFPVEIVSPIFDADENGFKMFKAHWDTYIMDKNFIYSTNNSQGFHIHISNDKLDKLKLLKLWYVFEDVFFKIFPNRMNNIYIYSIREKLHYLYDTNIGDEIINKLTEDGEENVIIDKYTTLNLSISGTNHVEFRIHPGTMNFIEIYNWIKLVLIFTAYTIKNNTKDIKLKIINNLSVDEKFYYLFSNVIGDKSLLDYYLYVIVNTDIKKKYNLTYPKEYVIPPIPELTDDDLQSFGIFV